MLKQFIQLVVNQLVPKRAVTGGGSKLIYGKEAGQFGLPVWPSPKVVNLPDSDAGYQDYIATEPCLVCLYAANSPDGVENGHIALSAGGHFISLIRRKRYNGGAFCYAKKGDSIGVSYAGTGVYLYIHPLVLPT